MWGFGAALAATIVLLLCGVIGASGLDDYMPSTLDVGDAGDNGFGLVVALLFQLVSMAFFGTLGGSLDSEGMGLLSEASLSVRFVPVLVLLAALAVTYWRPRKTARSGPVAPLAERMVLSAATGLGFAFLMLILGLVFAVRISEDYFKVSFDAVDLLSFIAAFVLVGLAAFLGASAKADKILPASWSSAFSLFGSHYLVGSVVAGLVMLILVVKDGGFSAFALAPAYLPTLAGYGYGMLHLGAISVPGMAGSSLSLFGDSIPVWATLLGILLALVLAVTASTRWALTRPAHPGGTATPASWMMLPAAFTLGGAALSLVTYVGFGGTFMGSSGTGGMGLAAWVFLLLGLWGVGIEALSRLIASRLTPFIPAGLRRVLVFGAPAAPATSGFVGGSESPWAAAVVTVDAPMPTAGPARMGEAPMPPVEPLSDKAKRNIKLGAIGAGVIIALAMGGSLGHSALNKGAFGPQGKVENYLHALMDGRAQAAVDILDPNVSGGARLLLTDEIFSKAENRITGFRIIKTVVDHDQAAVTAEIEQDQVKTAQTFTLRTLGKQALIFNDWEMVSGPAGTVSVAAEQAGITVNGVKVELPVMEPGDSVELPGLPGTYLIGADASDRFRSFGEPVRTTVSVASNGASAPVELFSTYTAAFATEAKAAASAYVDKCMEATELQPEGCFQDAYSSYSGDDLRKVTWEMTSGPEYIIETGYDGSVEMYVRGGQATANYEKNTARHGESATWEKSESVNDVYFSGSVFIAGDKVRFEAGN
ncbi:hypothetical protein GCM10023166_09250 [Paeniglutamicibacter cryotolerans]